VARSADYVRLVERDFAFYTDQYELLSRASLRRLKGLEGDIIPISMDLVFRLDDEEAVMEARIKNNSPETVRECWFPLLSGLTSVSKKGTSYLTVPFWMGNKVADPSGTLPLSWDAKWKLLLMYPGVCSMPWFDFFDSRQGLYLASHDPSFQTTTLVTRRREKTRDFQMGIVKYPFIGRGESWSSGDLIISAHEGDWHAGAKKYRNFADTWFEAASDIPKWMYEAPGICDLFMKHQNKRIYFGYDELLRIDNENRRKGLNIPLYVFSWHRNGHDVGYPEYYPDPVLSAALIVWLKDPGGLFDPAPYRQGHNVYIGSALQK